MAKTENMARRDREERGDLTILRRAKMRLDPGWAGMGGDLEDHLVGYSIGEGVVR